MELTRGVDRLAQSAAILRTTGSLVGSVVVTSGLGFGFWWVAARSFSPEAVGLSGAVVSAMLLLSKLGVMGIGTALVGVLPHHHGDRSSLIASALLLAAAIGGSLGVAFALLAPLASPALAPLSEHLAMILLFAAGVGLAAIGNVFDQATIGLLRGGLQLLRNTVFASAKLVAIAAVGLAAGASNLAIFATWVGGELVSLVIVGALVLRGRRVMPQPREWRHLLDLAGHAAAHHVLNVGRFAPSLVLPVVVAAMLSPSANATFYVALLLASVVQIVSVSSTFSLFAVARRDIGSLPRQIRLTLVISTAAALAGIVTLAVAAEPLLGLFGRHYLAGRDILLILAVTGVPLIVKDHWIAVYRIRDRVGRASAVVLAGAALEILGAVVGGLVGDLRGLGIGWLAGILVVAVFMVPTVRSEMSDGAPAA